MHTIAIFTIEPQTCTVKYIKDLPFVTKMASQKTKHLKYYTPLFYVNVNGNFCKSFSKFIWEGLKLAFLLKTVYYY